MPRWTSQALALALLGDKDALLISSSLSVAAPEGAGQAVASFMLPTGTDGGVVGLGVDILDSVRVLWMGWLAYEVIKTTTRTRYWTRACGGLRPCANDLHIMKGV